MTSSTMRLLDWARTYGPEVLGDVTCAIEFAQAAHRGCFRLSGDPYVVHCVEVALVLADRGDPPELVVAALLHNVSTVSAGPSLTEIEERLGADVAVLLAEYATLHYREYDVRWEKADPRVLQIKVADRVHNMRTVRYIAPDKQRRWALQTRELVAPLAYSLGLDDLGAELERLAVSTLRSTDYPREAALVPARTNHSGLRTSALRGALHLGAAVLPRSVRARWRQDWDGELYACSTPRERFAFAWNVLAGLPVMALATRRTDKR